MVALGQLFLDSEHVNEEYWKIILKNIFGFHHYEICIFILFFHIKEPLKVM